MDCGTIDNRLIRVDASLMLLANEKVGNKLDDTRTGVEPQVDFTDARLVDLGIAENLLSRVRSTTYPGRALPKWHESGKLQKSIHSKRLSISVDE